MAVEAQRLTRGIGARWHAVRRRYKWWQLTLFVIGVIAAVTVFSALFFAVGDKPARIYTDTAPPPVDSSALRNSAQHHRRRACRARRHDHDAEQRRRVRARAARCRSRTRNGRSTSRCTSGRKAQFSDQLLAALEKKQREGVTVRVLLDGLGSIKVPDEDFEALVAAGGKVQKFRTPKFGKLTRFHRRNHRRSIVIDGEIGFTGGMAVADIWLGNAQDTEHWRDIMFKVTGPLARSLQSAFVDLWVSSSGELLIDPKNYPVNAPAACDRGRAVHPPGQLAG